MEIIAVVNQKGGVGKTTTCMNLAAAFAAIRKRVLVVDSDPQGNASTGLGILHEARAHNIYHVLIGQAKMSDVIQKTSIDNLYIATSTVDLAAAELELRDFEQRQYILRNALSGLRTQFDYVIIDCPPSLGLLTINALSAAHDVIIPLQCEFFSLEGLSHLLKTIKLIKKNYNPALDIRGILLTMYDRRNRLSEQVAKEVRQHLGDKLFYTVIPRNIKVSEAPSFGKPAIAYDIKCPGSAAYVRLAKEIINQENEKKYA